jgi:hypothetical protein
MASFSAINAWNVSQNGPGQSLMKRPEEDRRNEFWGMMQRNANGERRMNYFVWVFTHFTACCKDAVTLHDWEQERDYLCCHKRWGRRSQTQLVWNGSWDIAIYFVLPNPESDIPLHASSEIFSNSCCHWWTKVDWMLSVTVLFRHSSCSGVDEWCRTQVAFHEVLISTYSVWTTALLWYWYSCGTQLVHVKNYHRTNHWHSNHPVVTQ